MSTTIRRLRVALVLTALAAAVIGPAAPATGARPGTDVIALYPSDPPVIRG